MLLWSNSGLNEPRPRDPSRPQPRARESRWPNDRVHSSAGVLRGAPSPLATKTAAATLPLLMRNIIRNVCTCTNANQTLLHWFTHSPHPCRTAARSVQFSPSVYTWIQVGGNLIIQFTVRQRSSPCPRQGVHNRYTYLAQGCHSTVYCYVVSEWLHYKIN